MKRLLFVVLLFLLSLQPVLGESEAYIITDLAGSPRYSATSTFEQVAPMSLLDRVGPCFIRLLQGHKLTLTKLADGSRIQISGPSEGRLTSKGYTPKPEFKGSVHSVTGRGQSESELRSVSATMGAGLLRTEESAGVVLASKGLLLHPELLWVFTDEEYLACDLTLADGDGRILKEWKRISADNLDLSPLELERGATYIVRLTPLEKYLEGPPVQAKIQLADEPLLKEAEMQKAAAWDDYRKDPNDLSPLTIYLAFLVDRQLLCDAYRLTGSEEFAGQKLVRKKLEMMLCK
ncbi:MAG: hypothetical protein KC800_01665 [Candidatus Eremiobacteraeota bacterium]|nr:hypothetical protein [Candidatus Eremiobacteraeota bacterium]